MELEFSRFLNNSTLSTLNSQKILEVSNRFLNVIKLSKDIHQKTN
jgi:thiamine biosynthesis lipoprotein ApbE